MIFNELKRFAEQSFGPGTFDRLLEASHLGPRIYLPVQAYPDEEIVALVAAAHAATELPVEQLLERFGQFLVPTYLKMYGHLVKPDWGPLDVIENAEETIHRVVRMRNPGAAPPKLETSRVGPKEVVVVYTSPRRLCAVARGISQGVANHYRSTVAITEPACMHKGAPACRIHVRLV